MMRLSLLLLAACNLDSSLNTVDSSLPDTPSDGPEPCTESMPFAAPVQVGGVNSAENDESGALSGDETLLVFSSNRNAPGTSNYDLSSRRVAPAIRALAHPS
jgi:hypothetical protein